MGTTAIGIQTSKGVILAVEKRVSSPLLEASSIEKIMEVDSHLAVALSGMVADARTLVDYGRVAAQVYFFYCHCYYHTTCRRKKRNEY